MLICYVDFLSLFKIVFSYLLSAVLGLHCCLGYSLAAVHGLLIAVVSLVSELEL